MTAPKLSEAARKAAERVMAGAPMLKALETDPNAKDVVRQCIAHDIQAAIDEQANAWKPEADRFEREVAEFGHPVGSDWDHHPVRDYLAEAFEAGKREAQERYGNEKRRLESRAEQAKPLAEALEFLLGGIENRQRMHNCRGFDCSVCTPSEEMEAARKALEAYEGSR